MCVHARQVMQLKEVMSTEVMQLKQQLRELERTEKKAEADKDLYDKEVADLKGQLDRQNTQLNEVEKAGVTPKAPHERTHVRAGAHAHILAHTHVHTHAR